MGCQVCHKQVYVALSTAEAECANHINFKYLFIHEQVNSRNRKLKYCPTDKMTADMLTKPFSIEQFNKFRKRAGIV